MRWGTDDDRTQGALFDEVERHAGRGEFRGMEFLHVHAKRIINTLPRSGRLPFRHTINAYRGCSHACSYCLEGDTQILLANGRSRALAELCIGDEIIGTEQIGTYRRYVPTTVLDHWATRKSAYRITLDDGTELVASGDHRFLSNRGWKHVVGTERGSERRPHLTTNNTVLGPGAGASLVRLGDGPDYRRGYVCGMVRGDAHLGHYRYNRPGRGWSTFHRFRLALTDHEPLERTHDYLERFGVTTTKFVFQPPTATTKLMTAIRSQSHATVEAVEELVRWPTNPSDEWHRGFLGGIFDAEGGCSRAILRIANSDEAITERITAALARFGFSWMVERLPRSRPMSNVRLLGGLPEQLRFFSIVDPATSRKRTIVGRAVKNSPARRVKSIEPAGDAVPLFDITTGTGDFIANGVISHNCFARPTHGYLDLDIAEGFERQIVVKVNAVERLRAELHPRHWAGEAIAMGTNTDPYQRCEGRYRLTRGLIEVLGEAGNPFSILTKSSLVLRDVDVLVEAATRADVAVNLSVGTLDAEVWKATEPGTPHPRQRLDAVARLRAAGVRCGVLVAPVLPGLSDTAASIDAVVAASVEAGASSVSGGMVLHLRPGTREVYLDHLARTHPRLLPRYEALFRSGAYVPRAVQQRVSGLVDDALARHRGVRVSVAGHTPAPPPSAAPAPPAPHQLGLAL